MGGCCESSIKTRILRRHFSRDHITHIDLDTGDTAFSYFAKNGWLFGCKGKFDTMLDKTSKTAMEEVEKRCIRSKGEEGIDVG